jgi:uncharacterized damage-inducible protein DinB
MFIKPNIWLHLNFPCTLVFIFSRSEYHLIILQYYDEYFSDQIIPADFVNSDMRQLVELWKEGRTRFTNQLANIKSEDLPKKLGGSPNSAGFLIRHVAEVELLFAKNVFGNLAVKVDAQTLKAGRDTGEWTDLDSLIALVQEAGIQLQKAIENQSDWESIIETREFGKKTKAEALGRITTHTAYHAGQLALVLKYGV